VKFGDELTVTLTCKQLTPRDSAEYGEVRWDADVTRQDGESVARYDVLTLVAKKDESGGTKSGGTKSAGTNGAQS
jgi:oxepin-CoA hydrolase/3-oxo-5,6-dehydrosuberyl-CoA semialdehyde dehydrogenase